MVGIGFVDVANLGGGFAAGDVGAAAFGADIGFEADAGADNFAVAGVCFLVSVGNVFLFVAHDHGGSVVRIDMAGGFERNHFVGAVLVFAVFAGLTFAGAGFSSVDVFSFALIFFCWCVCTVGGGFVLVIIIVAVAVVGRVVSAGSVDAHIHHCLHVLP